VEWNERRITPFVKRTRKEFFKFSKKFQANKFKPKISHKGDTRIEGTINGGRERSTRREGRRVGG
jgi:hypothetical protein